MKPLFTAALLVFCLIGCAGRNAIEFTSGPFKVAPKRLGRTALLTRNLLPGTQPDDLEKKARLQTMIEEIFGAIPEAEIVSETPLMEALAPIQWQDAGDLDLSRAARARGLDTVAVVTVERYLGELTISLAPPYWKTTTSFRYRVRLVDANSGGLLMEAYRAVENDGLFRAAGPKDLDDDFRRNLADLLGAPQPAPARS